LKTETLNVIEPSTGRVLGTIEPDIIRLDKLLLHRRISWMEGMGVS
jgi:hypothetical protein